LVLARETTVGISSRRAFNTVNLRLTKPVSGLGVMVLATKPGTIRTHGNCRKVLQMTWAFC
jgi:hypothetical protein